MNDHNVEIKTIIVKGSDELHQEITNISNKGYQVIYVATAEVYVKGTDPEDTIIFAAKVREEWLAKNIVN